MSGDEQLDEVRGWVVVTFGGGGPEQCGLPRCPIGALYFRDFLEARAIAAELSPAFEPHVLPILDMLAAAGGHPATASSTSYPRPVEHRDLPAPMSATAARWAVRAAGPQDPMTAGTQDPMPSGPQDTMPP